MSVGSPLCQASVTCGTRCARRGLLDVCPHDFVTHAEPAARVQLLLLEKKQMSQRRLHRAPVGLAVTWKAGTGASVGLDGRDIVPSGLNFSTITPLDHSTSSPRTSMSSATVRTLPSSSAVSVMASNWGFVGRRMMRMWRHGPSPSTFSLS